MIAVGQQPERSSAHSHGLHAAAAAVEPFYRGRICYQGVGQVACAPGFDLMGYRNGYDVDCCSRSEVENPGACRWFGTAPKCEGACPAGWKQYGGDNDDGDGYHCYVGTKKMCCPPGSL